MAEQPLIAGRYQLQQRIGKGGMARVSLGTDTRLNRPVAIKSLLGEYTANPDFRRRFEREARTAAQLTNPHVVQVYDYGIEAETPYIVMEYVRGKTLRELLQEQGRPPPQRAAEVMADVASALESAHERGIVHRDVKPANVMIDAEGVVKVADFGIAQNPGDDTQLTQAGAVLGTAMYISPEQARGEHADARSDVYSMGVVLWELLVGYPPFRGDASWAIAFQHANEPVPRPSSEDPSVPPDLEAIAMKALDKEPARRYPSAAEMRADLRRYIRGETPLAVTEYARAGPTPPAAAMVTAAMPTRAAADTTPPGKPAKKSQWATVVAIVLIVIALGVGSFLVARAFTGRSDTTTTTTTVPDSEETTTTTPETTTTTTTTTTTSTTAPPDTGDGSNGGGDTSGGGGGDPGT